MDALTDDAALQGHGRAHAGRLRAALRGSAASGGHGAPNVVFVLLDDTGFAQFGCFGSDIDTPNVDALSAAGGLQFTNFHVDAGVLADAGSAADRAVPARGRHARPVPDWAHGLPACGSATSRTRAATVAEVLQRRGVRRPTACGQVAPGAGHQAVSAAGPFDQWPLGRGFDRFYGFLRR